MNKKDCCAKDLVQQFFFVKLIYGELDIFLV